LPIKIIQSNSKVAEVQFICDKCGQPIHTSLVPKKEVEKHQNVKLVCYNCKKIENKPNGDA
jgi:hypothetical protein